MNSSTSIVINIQHFSKSTSSSLILLLVLLPTAVFRARSEDDLPPSKLLLCCYSSHVSIESILCSVHSPPLLVSKPVVFLSHFPVSSPTAVFFVFSSLCVLSHFSPQVLLPVSASVKTVHSNTQMVRACAELVSSSTMIWISKAQPPTVNWTVSPRSVAE